MALPTNISYGTVVGQFLASIADGNDPDKLPEGVAMSGTVIFIASAQYVLDYSATPNPVTVVKTPITCPLDSNGYLCGPYVSTESPLSPGVQLVATDDPDLQPVGWTWTVMYNLTDPLGNRVNMPTQSINVPTGGTVDLTTAMNIASSGGVFITKGDPNVLTIGTVSTLSSTASATAEITGTSPNQILNLGLPQGIQGVPNVLNVGTITTLAAGSSASASITGTSPTQTLNLSVPRGDQGVQGNPGDMALVSASANITGTVTLVDSDLPSTRLRTLTGNVTFVLPTPSSSLSGTITLVLTQDATGGRTITWPANTILKWPDGIAQQPAAAANSISVVHLLWTGTTWLGMLGGKSFA